MEKKQPRMARLGREVQDQQHSWPSLLAEMSSGDCDDVIRLGCPAHVSILSIIPCLSPPRQ